MVPRVAAVVVSLLAIAWLAGNLDSISKADAGKRALAAKGRSGCDPAVLDAGAAHYRGARRLGSDAQLYVDEAEAIVARCPGRARGLLERAVRLEPESQQAWVLLFLATKDSDPARAAQARRRAAVLEPLSRPVLRRLSRP